MAIAMNFNYGNGNIHWMQTLDTPGKRLKALRAAKGLTQMTVAGLAKIDQSTLSDAENDKALSAEYLMRLCEVLGSDPLYVMRGTSSAEDVLQRVQGLLAQAQNEKTSLADVSAKGKPATAPAAKARTLRLVSPKKKPQLDPVVRRKLVGNKGADNERSASKTKKKPRNGKTP